MRNPKPLFLQSAQQRKLDQRRAAVVGSLKPNQDLQNLKVGVPASLFCAVTVMCCKIHHQRMCLWGLQSVKQRHGEQVSDYGLPKLEV